MPRFRNAHPKLGVLLWKEALPPDLAWVVLQTFGIPVRKAVRAN